MLGSQLLLLRHNTISTVATLLGGIEHAAAAESPHAQMMRRFALKELGDAVLANVAVYALEAYWGDTPVLVPRRASASSRRRQRSTDPGPFHQRRLFAQ